MRQGGNPGRSQDRNSGGKTIKERLSNITTAFQADRKRRKPPHTASPIITTTAAAAAAAASATSSGRVSSHDRSRRAAPAPLKSLALQHFVPTHTPDRPSRPGAAAAATPPSLSLPTTRHGSFASTGGDGGSGSSGHGSGVLVVHLDSPPPPLYEQPRPAPMPWLTSSGGGPPGTEGWRHNQQQQQQYYRSSPSPMRQQSAASSRSVSTTTTTHRHRNKELPPLRTDDGATAHMWRGEGRPRGMWREDDCDHGRDAGHHQPSRGEFSPSLSPSRHGRPRKVAAAAAAAACRLCRRRACELSVGQRDATLCRHCELAPMSAAMARARGESGSVSSLSSGSHYGDDQSPARQHRRRAQESEPLDAAAAAAGSEYSSRVGSVSSDSRAGSPFPLEVARGVALTATPCSPREVDVVGSPASARSDADPRHPHHTFDFGFSTAHAAEEGQDRGAARGDAAVGPATTPPRRLVVVEQRPVIAADDGDDEALDWGTQWSPAYYFGEPGAGEAGGSLGKAVRRRLEADNERASGGSHDSMSPELTPTSPILSRLPSEDRITRAGVLCVPKRREEPTLFI
ncbi:hypothetical protein RB594_009118 [Gaeumannomyces avenae]